MKKVILVVSYGVAGKAAWEKSLGRLEEEIRRHWPEWDVYQAFTGRRILEKCRAQGFEMPDEKQLREKLIGEEYDRIVVLPVYVNFGKEYSKAIETVASEASADRTGLPLLGDEVWRRKVAEGLRNEVQAAQDETVLYVGHGSKQEGDRVYELLEEDLHQCGQKAVVGSLEKVEEALDRIKTKKTVIVPLLLTAGKHALNDVCGDERHSVAARLRGAGNEVRCIEKGLMEYEAIRQIYLDQLRELICE